LGIRVIGAEAPSDVLGHNPDVLGLASKVVSGQMLPIRVEPQTYKTG
jgi:hypothetical protein